MPEESTTPDLIDSVRRGVEAFNRRDLDAMMSLCAPDAVLDLSHRELPSCEGVPAIRRWVEDWWGAFEDLRFELEEVFDLGKGVTFSVIRQDARPAGSSGHVRTREAHVIEWVAGVIVRLTAYADIDEGRVAAERLAESRG